MMDGLILTKDNGEQDLHCGVVCIHCAVEVASDPSFVLNWRFLSRADADQPVARSLMIRSFRCRPSPGVREPPI